MAIDGDRLAALVSELRQIEQALRTWMSAEEAADRMCEIADELDALRTRDQAPPPEPRG